MSAFLYILILIIWPSPSASLIETVSIRWISFIGRWISLKMFKCQLLSRNLYRWTEPGLLSHKKCDREGDGTHSRNPAWKIPWTEEPGGLQSMGSLRVGHDWVTSLLLFTFMHWRRKWQPTPVFLPGESQGLGSLVGCCLWGRIESDMTEATEQQQQQEYTGS